MKHGYRKSGGWRRSAPAAVMAVLHMMLSPAKMLYRLTARLIRRAFPSSQEPEHVFEAQIARTRITFAAAIIVAAAAIWVMRHTFAMMAVAKGDGSRFATVFAVGTVALLWTVFFCYFERRKTASPERQRELDKMYVLAVVPTYNEGAEYLRACLLSLLRQERLPNCIYVVDDGSTVDYGIVRREFMREATECGVRVFWGRTANRGKRHAQSVAIRNVPSADIILTVDSDAKLDPRAIAEGMKGFADPRVSSVAGVFVTSNSTKNILTRGSDVFFTTGQLVDRSALSVFGSVLVNSGVFALYRGDFVRRHLDAYLGETFMGRPVSFSDDSWLTMVALLHGRVVQQPTAFVSSAMPERLSHHVRQQLRWMRGAFIRSMWRIKYLRKTSYAFWSQVLSWYMVVVSSTVFVSLFIVQPILERRLLPQLFLMTVLIGYGRGLRFLTVRRSDETLRSQLLSFALSPLAWLWVFVFLRGLRWYAIATCWKTGKWGTRKEVELGATKTSLAA